MSISIALKEYTLTFERNADGGYGYAVYSNAAPTRTPKYRTADPVRLHLKDYACSYPFYNGAYTQVSAEGKKVFAQGEIATPLGSVFLFEDIFEPFDEESAFKMSRKVTVLSAHEDDLGFGSQFSVGLELSQNTLHYNYFAPGGWYKQNEDAPKDAPGTNLDYEHNWFRETRYALPLFTMQHITSGDTITLCHVNADVSSGRYERNYDSFISDTFRYGSIGMSTPGGLSVDYVYPGTEGKSLKNPYRNGPYAYHFNYARRFNNVRVGNTQQYELVFRVTKNESYYDAMRGAWRYFYNVYNPKIHPVDNRKVFTSGMDLFDKYCREYNGVMGVPFKILLPDGDPGHLAYQMGFIGQQPNIGYQLIRYGYTEEAKFECVKKGEAIIDFWVKNSLTEWGLPKTWYGVTPAEFLDQPIFLRKIGDGMEGILDAYVLMKKKGAEHPEWLHYCKRVADWFVNNISQEGAWCRAYNFDGSVKMDGKGNTTNIIRFLVQLYLVTRDERYKETALKAGEFSYDFCYKNFHYVGGTADNNNVLDKEAGLYAFFAFLSLFDLTEDEKWLEAAKGAADYAETWTYSWSFPVKPIEPANAYNKAPMIGQSLIATGHSACDVYTSAFSYISYRLYLHTGDTHYLDYARFIHKDSKLTTNWNGQLDYKVLGLCEEGGDVSAFDYRGITAWLPWCTYVQVDPISRFVDTFGEYEIEECEKLPMEERIRRNRIYEYYGK